MRGVALLLAGVVALAAGCSSGTAAVTNTAAVSAAPTALAAAALPLTEAEHDFVAALAAERIGEGIDVRTLVGYGNTACTALSADAATPAAAATAVKSAGALDDATAQAIVRAATEHLCSSSSTTAADSTRPNST